MKWHLTYRKNMIGIDYFVGDIHGAYETLIQELVRIKFDFDKDRLFSVGDIINKGSHSFDCAMLLKKKWFKSIMGNHEFMFQSYYKNRHMINELSEHGGGWVANQKESDLKKIYDLFNSKLSLSATVKTKDGSVGIVHASCPQKWSYLEMYPPTAEIQTTLRDFCLWDFNQGSSPSDCDVVSDIDAIVSGHISTRSIIKKGNHLWIDTLMPTGKLTIISSKEVFERLNS